MQNEKQVEGMRKLPHINFRLFLFCALGLLAGIALYFAIRLQKFALYSFVPFVLIVFFALRPFSCRRILAICAVVLCFLGTGAGLAHWTCERFLSGVPTGEYEVQGTVETVTIGRGFRSCTLKNLSFNGVSSDGKMTVSLSGDEIRTGDVVRFTATVNRTPLPYGTKNAYRFAKDVRYAANLTAYEKTGERGALLRLNAGIYDLLNECMTRDEASVAYALLTGNSSSMDEGLAEAVRQGGIAHIFAVSGLHIGIVYSAVLFLCKPLKRFAPLPALAFAVCYSALCAFTVSSVRALIMCAVLSAYRILGRKNDLLTSLSLAALVILLISPAQYLSAGFLLSFGAVLGLALFSHTLVELFRKIKLPAFLANYLGACLSVQLFTFPLLMELFGYASVWAFLFNLFLLPCMPVLLLVLLFCTLFALITTWTGIMMFPAGMISLLLFVLAAVDFSFVITGFALGAGGAVIVTGCVLLTQRVRMGTLWKGIGAGCACALFALVVVLENVTFSGCRLTAYSTSSGDAVLVRTPHERVLVIDGDISLRACNDFLSRNYGGKLDAVICLSDAEINAINVAAFLKTDAVYAMEEIPTGLQKTNVIFAEEVKIGELTVRYETRGKAVLFVQNTVVEIDFENDSLFACDLFLGRGGSGDYRLKKGVVRKR